MAMAATKKKAMKLFKRSKEREEKLEKLNVEEKRYIKENEVDKDIALMIFPTMIELQTHLYKELMEYCVWLLSQLNKDMNSEFLYLFRLLSLS